MSVISGPIRFGEIFPGLAAALPSSGASSVYGISAPVPEVFSREHRVRRYVKDFFGAADYAASDWNIQTVGTGAAALVATSGNAANTGPFLDLATSANINDGMSYRHNAKHLHMPSILSGLTCHQFYLAFDWTFGGIMPQNLAFGVATDTAAGAYNTTTGVCFGTGGGIAWVRNAGLGAYWQFQYKPSAKAYVTPIPAQAAANVQPSNTSSNSRFGFMVMQGNDTLNTGTSGYILAFAHKLLDNNQLGPTGGGDTRGDDSERAPIGQWWLVPMDETNYGDVASMQAGIFMGIGTTSASIKHAYLKRIVCIDNLRR